MDTCAVLNSTLAWDFSKSRNNTVCLKIDFGTLYALLSAAGHKRLPEAMAFVLVISHLLQA